MLYSFCQLYGYHVFGLPLPKSAAAGYCRECGGPLETPNKDKYGNNWLDEGLIMYSESLYTCPACVEAKKGSNARTLLAPPYATVMLVAPAGTHPAPDMLRRCHGKSEKGMKSALYENGLTVERVLREYRAYPVPFGVVVGTGGDAKKHFLRSVPLNYEAGDIMAVYGVPAYRAAYLRPSLLLAAAEEAARWGPQAEEEGEKKRRNALSQFYRHVRELQERYGLTQAEAFVLRMVVKSYAPSEEQD